MRESIVKGETTSRPVFLSLIEIINLGIIVKYLKC
nr:MAG TPA: hypothetical protein [Microviridae sp.]